MQRRLAAILAADVVGYSRLMGADEVKTLTSLNHTVGIDQPDITEYHGRLSKLPATACWSNFPSVVDVLSLR